MNDASDDTPLADLLAAMSLASLEVSNLDPERLMLVRIAALIAVDAPPASYLLNLRSPTRPGSTGRRSGTCSLPWHRSSARLASRPRSARSPALSASLSSWPSSSSQTTPRGGTGSARDVRGAGREEEGEAGRAAARNMRRRRARGPQAREGEHAEDTSERRSRGGSRSAARRAAGPGKARGRDGGHGRDSAPQPRGRTRDTRRRAGRAREEIAPAGGM